ncbi:MAG: ATP-binding cassette domain-containing protein [Alkalinema sp. RU_4_3]|nr:ATP-binding cassette domain-containing protein [Alkalinema sp. RU_4_3]
MRLTVGEGEVVALVGPSGAGKTTLLNVLNLSLGLSGGRLELFGQAVGERRRLQRLIGTVYQRFELVPSLRVIHNLNAGRLAEWPAWKAFWSLLYPLGVREARRVLERVGMGEKLFERTDRLSGGQLQRVAIARMLLQDPRLILADEPVASLDPVLGREVLGLLRAIALEGGRGLVVSLHDVGLARGFCDRMVGVKGGEVMFNLPIDAVGDDLLGRLYEV